MAQEPAKQAPAPAKDGAKPAKTNDMMNLFATSIVEDDSSGKLAKSLKDVGAKDLLWDAIDVRERLKGKMR